MKRSFITLIAALLIVGAVGAAQLDFSKTKETRPISILIEPGAKVPSLILFELDEGSDIEIRFEIVYGRARFLEGLKEVVLTSSEGEVRMPAIRPGPISDETLVRLTVDGVKIIDDLRVVAVPAGRIKVISETRELQSGIVAIEVGAYAVVDESKLDLSEQTSTRRLDPVDMRGEGRAPTTAIYPIYPYYPPGCFDLSGLEHCRRAPWGPGKVVWNMSNPTAAGYSVKPEDGPPGFLQYPSWPPTVWQAIDGIYRENWGCGVALKVAGSCTATVGTNQIDCCCNTALWLLGHDCEFIDPSVQALNDWSDCPLFYP